MKRYFDTVILGLGIFFLGFGCYLVYERLAPRQLVYAANVRAQSPTSPVRLTIASIPLDLSVYPATINHGKWDLTREGISYLSTSPLPGSLGNSVMYGHNWHNLLGKLKNIQVGAPIVITDNHGQTLTYLVQFISVVTQDETHIYSNTSDYRLTLYTCTGFLDSKRLVVTAILASSSN